MADADLFPDAPGDTPSDYLGHRARLRERLAAGGGEAFHDHELLEFLLSLGRPRVDTKPTAKALLKEFGGLGGVFAADHQSLARVAGMGELSIAALRAVQAVAVRLVKSRIADRPVLANWQALLDYLRADMAHHPIERFRVLHLNTRNTLTHDELMSEGTVDQAAVYVRKVVGRALALESAAVILVHNHPSGDPSPSRADIDITKAIAAAGKPLGIAVHDHLIIGTQGHVSLRAQGLL
ncbi:RadC family protein [Sphingomonas sp.]|uniref:RadC family protein n=1 Tax=Sphingomonas sp. TaxID=28214 RepID=UPI003CC63C5A